MKTIVLIVFLIIQNLRVVFAQEENNSEKIKQLLNDATILDSQGDYIGVIESLLKAVEIDTSLKQTKKILALKLKENIKLIEQSNRLDLLDKSFVYLSGLKQYDDQVISLIDFYYTNGYYEKLSSTLQQLIKKDINEIRISAEQLQRIDYEKDPETAIKIYKIILPFVYSPLIDVLPFAYRSRNQELINQIIRRYFDVPSEEISSDSLLVKRINSNFLLLDPKINPPLFRQICYVLKPYIWEEYQIELLVKLYTIKDFQQFDNQLEIVLRNNIYSESKLLVNSIIALDPEIDINRYKKLFAFIVKGLNIAELDSVISVKNNYKLSKNFYAASDEVVHNAFLNKIYKSITADIQESQNYIFWGVACLGNNEVGRAKRYFDNVILFGRTKDVDELNYELKWWSENGFKSEEINLISLEYFGEENQSKNDFDQSVIKNVNEEYLMSSFHALFIAVEDYTSSSLDLKYPVSDAQKLYNILTTRYSYLSDKIIFLKNPVRKDIIQTFTKLRKQLSINDNLLIFFAGHGYWDEEAEQGYWLPSDSEQSDQLNWISNSDVKSFIKSLKNKHTLLISDACFSGGIFKTREAFLEDNLNIDEVYKFPSRRAITSGYLKEVPDKSVFMEYIIKTLNDNNKKYLTSQKLYLLIRDAVINNSPVHQTPLYGIIYESGDEGGDFIFYLK